VVNSRLQTLVLNTMAACLALNMEVLGAQSGRRVPKLATIGVSQTPSSVTYQKKPAPAPPAPPPAPPAAPAPPDAHPDWYWQIVRAARLTNLTDIAVPYWTEANWTEWTSNYYINNPVQLVKQGVPKLFGPWSIKAAEEAAKEKEKAEE